MGGELALVGKISVRVKQFIDSREMLEYYQRKLNESPEASWYFKSFLITL